MIVLKIDRVMVALTLCVVPVVFSGCGGAGVVKSSPISSKRGSETLELVPGEVPRWKKTGNIKVKAAGERTDEESALHIKVKKGEPLRTIDAKGRDIVVSGEGGNLKITGICPKLLVTGSGNHLSCEFVEEIEITGDRNEMDCKCVRSGEVTGDGNTIGWKKPINDTYPLINFAGINNTIEHRSR